ncbi:triacylglycerol lipase [Nocardia brasiliensis]|uniref:Triacylglycerol lipase n=2 Tax=Nocardia brasiliensis TaxID=37326 RepID=A0A6G9Y2D1_NOCBR|nr:triacylglycerol lipase [Nocardia brasiliensis]
MHQQVPVQPPLPFPIPPAPPELDPGFYSPPADVVAAKKPGEIIAAREVHLAYYSVIPFNFDAWQLSYRSTDTRDEPIAAVTTLMKPRGDNGGIPRPLLSYQFPQDSNAQYCAPSYVLQQASVPGNITGQFDIPFEFVLPLTALGAGWAVAMPDHQGPNSAFAAGPLGARVTLDGIRAAENFAPMGLGPDTKIGLAGYSGGAITTGHTAELKASYAPELNVVGASEGGVPADIKAMYRMASGNLGAGLILSGLLGVANEYPELAAYNQQHMLPIGKAMAPVKNSLCLYSAALLPFMNLEGGLYDSPDPLDDPVPAAVFEALRMGHSVPDMPMFIFNSNPDWIAPVGPVNTLVDTYCRDPNARVHYTRDHFSEHITLEIDSMARVLLWLKERFDGVPAEPGCSIHDEGSMALDPASWPLWLQGAGTLLAGLLQQPIGSR